MLPPLSLPADIDTSQLAEDFVDVEMVARAFKMPPLNTDASGVDLQLIDGDGEELRGDPSIRCVSTDSQIPTEHFSELSQEFVAVKRH